MEHSQTSAKHVLAEANRLHQSGQLKEAEAGYRSVLKREPANAEAHHLLGILLAQTNRPAAALEQLDCAISLSPDVGTFHTNRGNVLRQMGDLAGAIKSYRRAVEIDPKDAESQVNLGLALGDAGQKEQALPLLKRAIELQPDFAIAYACLGNALRELGRLNEAIEAHQHAVELQPKSARFLANYALALTDVGRQNEAIELLEKVVALEPKLVEAHVNLSDAYRESGRLQDSVNAAARAAELGPDLPEPRINLANALMQQGRVDQAIGQYMAAVKIKPDMHQAVSNALYVVHNRVTDPKWLFEEHRKWGEVFATPRSVNIQPHQNRRDPSRRLRIGYVSADFRNHAVGRLLLPALEAHNREDFELICYSQGTEADDQTRHIRAATDRWQVIAGMSDDALAQQIRSDQVDILIDLAGHTAGDRLLAFALKPAPVQVTWLGYPDTTGMTAIDYRIVDSITDPPGQSDELNVEKLIRIDPCFICMKLEEATLEAAPQKNDPATGITFGCFNNFSKASPQAIQLWARVLSEIPDARLILRSRGLSYPGTVEHARQALQAQSVPLDRVEIRSHVEFGQHLAAYNEIDVALDSYPYSGTATTCDALSMGVPVITLAGSTHVSRVTASLLNAAGLSHWITQSPDAYVERARLSAANGRRTRDQREAFRDQVRRSALCDARSFAQKLEAAYRQMWRIWCDQPTSA